MYFYRRQARTERLWRFGLLSTRRLPVTAFIHAFDLVDGAVPIERDAYSWATARSGRVAGAAFC